MSCFKDLDQYTTQELTKELQKREARIREGKCDYCGRTGDMPPCRYPERHDVAVRQLEHLVNTMRKTSHGPK